MTFKNGTKMLWDWGYLTSMGLPLHSFVFLFMLLKWFFCKPIKKILDWRQFLGSGGKEMSLNCYIGEKNFKIVAMFDHLFFILHRFSTSLQYHNLHESTQETS